MKLTGDRCQCPTCTEYFNSTYAFDKHRVGAFPASRRCLSVEEMAAKGMLKNAAGFWISASKPERTPILRSGESSPAEIAPDPYLGSTPEGLSHPVAPAAASDGTTAAQQAGP